jgi:hypothetical protein
MGSRYLFIILYLWLERLLARDDYHRKHLGQRQKGSSQPIAEEIDA